MERPDGRRVEALFVFWVRHHRSTRPAVEAHPATVSLGAGVTRLMGERRYDTGPEVRLRRESRAKADVGAEGRAVLTRECRRKLTYARGNSLRVCGRRRDREHTDREQRDRNSLPHERILRFRWVDLHEPDDHS